MVKKSSLAIALLALSRPVFCQVATGTITISIQDASGGVVPGVSVTVLNARTGLTRAGVTNERGELAAPFLSAGEYVVSAEHPGFRKTSISGLELRVDQNAAII